MKGEQPVDFLTLGRLGAAYGVKGWIKIVSFADPVENILNYHFFKISDGSGMQDIEIDQCRSQGKGFVGHIKGCDDRDKTRDYCGKELLVEKSRLPELESGRFYWHQLVGLSVLNLAGDELGVVDHLIETGANDVLVVRVTATGVDDKERLIPFLSDDVIHEIDLVKRIIRVDWEADY